MSYWLDWKKERLPQPFTRVLVYVPGRGVYQGWCRGDFASLKESKRWNVAGIMSNDVTHWMPLPDPPMHESA